MRGGREGGRKIGRDREILIQTIPSKRGSCPRNLRILHTPGKRVSFTTTSLAFATITASILETGGSRLLELLLLLLLLLLLHSKQEGLVYYYLSYFCYCYSFYTPSKRVSFTDMSTISTTSTFISYHLYFRLCFLTVTILFVQKCNLQCSLRDS